MGEAEQQFKRALELDSKYTDARYNLASVEASDSEWAKAAQDFQEVLVTNPDHKNARQHLGEVLFMWAESLSKSGDVGQAVQRYRDSLVYRPDDPDLHAQLGEALAQMGKLPEAKAEFNSVLKINPGSQDARDALTQIDARERVSKK